MSLPTSEVGLFECELYEKKEVEQLKKEIKPVNYTNGVGQKITLDEQGLFVLFTCVVDVMCYNMIVIEWLLSVLVFTNSRMVAS